MIATWTSGSEELERGNIVADLRVWLRSLTYKWYWGRVFQAEQQEIHSQILNNSRGKG